MDLSDVELVALAKAAGDERAFAVLVRRHQARLRAFLLRLCGDPFFADDIAQDAFLKAHASLGAFKGGGSFRSWLFAIAYREFLQDRRRKKANARIESALNADPAGDELSNRAPDAGIALDLRRALSALGELERAALILCDAAGLSHAEAAAALDAPLGSVKTYVARARRKMRRLLNADDCNPAEPPNKPIAKGASYAV